MPLICPSRLSLRSLYLKKTSVEFKFYGQGGKKGPKRFFYQRCPYWGERRVFLLSEVREKEPQNTRWKGGWNSQGKADVGELAFAQGGVNQKNCLECVCVFHTKPRPVTQAADQTGLMSGLHVEMHGQAAFHLTTPSPLKPMPFFKATIRTLAKPMSIFCPLGKMPGFPFLVCFVVRQG